MPDSGLPRNLGHLMVDIETLGNISRSVICSIGAVEFDLETGEIGRTFYQNITIQSCLDTGLVINGSTIEWWFKQNDAARKALFSNAKALSQVLYEFQEFLQHLGTRDLQIWGNSPRFDLGILEDAYTACHKRIPWSFRQERDVRTLASFYPNLKRSAESAPGAHQPIEDCLFQIHYCHAIWKALKS